MDKEEVEHKDVHTKIPLNLKSHLNINTADLLPIFPNGFRIFIQYVDHIFQDSFWEIPFISLKRALTHFAETNLGSELAGLFKPPDSCRRYDGNHSGKVLKFWHVAKLLSNKIPAWVKPQEAWYLLFEHKYTFEHKSSFEFKHHHLNMEMPMVARSLHESKPWKLTIISLWT